MKNVFITVIMLVLVFITAVSINYALQKQDKMSCYKLQRYAEEYENFWITQEENEMCFAQNIEVNALVK